MEDNNSFLIKTIAGALILILALNVYRTESTKKQMDRLAATVASLSVRMDAMEYPDFSDIGSGAGFPGMALAIAFPSAKVTLIDATKKKFLFLEEVKKACEVENVEFHVGRVEDMRGFRESFDVVTSRGFAALRIFAEVGAPLLKVGGTLLAMKGSKGSDELHEATNALNKTSLHLSNSQKEFLSEASGTHIN